MPWQRREVADKAGVSFITVSRVINGLDNVKPETRARVEAAIKELNYHPNRQAQALNHGLTHTIAFVTPRMYDLPLYNNFFVMSLLSGVEIKGRELGFDLLLTTDFDLGGEFDFLRVWHQRKVDGIIFVAFRRLPIAQMRAIEERKLPCVSISDRIESPAISWVDADNGSAARDAINRFIALGHRSFAFIGIDPSNDYNPDILAREKAAAGALAERGFVQKLLISNSSTPSTGITAATAFLAMEERPTAVLSGNDSIALYFIAENARHGLFCPRDYSIIGFDAEPAGRIASPTLGSYEQPLMKMGKTVVEILVDQINGESAGRKTIEFPMCYVDGGSVGPAPRP